ncbi:radical SAM/SPASM domain-containing protein [Clostridium sp. KNHs214]|uniref:radical SAM/SPASM domain-containing protein n=1 Tax=Clostridium sp. KNHs214 TaxID=1540257 RepID=UPI00054F0C04|nr:radical SAM/SPASM domain-containing protein [Clostridium sp. KNHs214]
MKNNTVKKYVPINKGNYTLETENREKEYERKRAIGFEKEYYEYRKKWTELAKNLDVTEYPLEVGLELSSVCNLKCPFCYTITEGFQKKVSKKFMETKLAKKIIDEIGGKVVTLRLSFRGETTLNPDLIEIIKYAKQKNIKEISFLTNGSKLEPDYFEQLLLAGVDWIIISFDGLYEEYDKNRYPLKFNDMIHKLTKMKEIKEKYNSEKPVIKVQTIWPAIEKNPFEYYEKLAPLTDMVSYLPLIKWNVGLMPESYYIDNFSCPMLYQRLFITSDGQALPCCANAEGQCVVGDAYSESIYDIWHGKKLNTIRELHVENEGFKKIEACRKCFIPRKTKDDVYQYGNRKIIVKNYLD